MPVVTGELKDIVGATLVSRVGKIGFRLVAPNIVATGASAGRVIPTAVELITPSSDGSFSVNLTSTNTMLGDGYYVLFIEWTDATLPKTDFPGWQIRVGASGGPLSGFIEFGNPSGGGGGGNGPNLSLVLLGLTKPANLKVGQLWWKTDPNDPYGAANTGLIYVGG